jgi:hypothetical protein
VTVTYPSQDLRGIRTKDLTAHMLMLCSRRSWPDISFQICPVRSCRNDRVGCEGWRASSRHGWRGNRGQKSNGSLRRRSSRCMTGRTSIGGRGSPRCRRWPRAGCRWSGGRMRAGAGPSLARVVARGKGGWVDANVRRLLCVPVNDPAVEKPHVVPKSRCSRARQFRATRD